MNARDESLKLSLIERAHAWLAGQPDDSATYQRDALAEAQSVSIDDDPHVDAAGTYTGE